MSNVPTHITVVLDRTGSMDAIRDDVIGGYNAFLAEQQKEAGQATLTLVQFDSQDPFEIVYEAVPIQRAKPLSRATFVPRASTPLYDALGRALVSTEAHLERLPLAMRPKNVIVAVVTDGQENASREFTSTRVRQLLTAKEKEGWRILFLSADLAAFEDATSLGVADYSKIHFDATAEGTKAAFAAKSRVILQSRRAEEPKGFTDDDRKSTRN